MSKDQGKKKTELKQQKAPATKQKQQVKTTELTDADLDKVAGGGATPTPNYLMIKMAGD